MSRRRSGAYDDDSAVTPARIFAVPFHKVYFRCNKGEARRRATPRGKPTIRLLWVIDSKTYADTDTVATPAIPNSLAAARSPTRLNAVAPTKVSASGRNRRCAI